MRSEPPARASSLDAPAGQGSDHADVWVTEAQSHQNDGLSAGLRARLVGSGILSIMGHLVDILGHAALSTCFVVVGLASACSTEDSVEPALEARPLAPFAPAPSGESVGTSKQPIAAPGCEELGRVVGTSLAARLVSSTQRSIALPLANRAVASRVAVVGVGLSTSLTGKTVPLGTGDNANYATCTHCLVAAIGCTTDCSKAAWFFARSGTALFTAVPGAPGQAFTGRYTDVILEEVRVDLATGHSSKVEGGACLHIEELAFDGSTASSTSPTDGGSTSSSSGGTADGGSSGAASPSDAGTGSSSGSGGGGKGTDSHPIDPF